jgi:hypothetical protein
VATVNPNANATASAIDMLCNRKNRIEFPPEHLLNRKPSLRGRAVRLVYLLPGIRHASNFRPHKDNE